eukprot:EG_transcript_4686
MEQLLALAALQHAVQRGQSVPQEYAGEWTFFDTLRSVDCNADDTVAWCVHPVDATVPTKQAFPAAADHSITLEVRQADLARPFVVGILPQRPDLSDCGKHHLGQRGLRGSVGLVFSKAEAQYMANGEFFGATSATIRAGSVVTLTVRDRQLHATVDGCALAPVPAVEDRYRFGVSLCGEGQKVAITPSSRPPSKATPTAAVPPNVVLPEGEALVGCRVTVKSGEEAAAAIADSASLEGERGIILRLKCDRFGGDSGDVVKLDSSDNMYLVDLGRGGVHWFPAEGLTLEASASTPMVPGSRSDAAADELPPGTQVTIKPEAEVRTALRHTRLEAAMHVPFCGNTGSVLRYDSDDNTYLVDVSGIAIWFTRRCFDVSAPADSVCTGWRVQMRSAADIERVLQGTSLGAEPITRSHAGRTGRVVRSDPADAMYLVDVGGVVKWVTRGCFDVAIDGGFTRWHVGDKVVRGPTWQWGDQDGGAGTVGTVVAVDCDGPEVVRVAWPHGLNQVVTTDCRQTDVQPCPESSPVEGGPASPPQPTADSIKPHLVFTPTGGLLRLLRQLHVAPYAELLTNAGYNSLEALQFATAEDLQSLGVKRPHALLLMKHLPCDDAVDFIESAGSWPSAGSPARPAAASDHRGCSERP